MHLSVSFLMLFVFYFDLYVYMFSLYTKMFYGAFFVLLLLLFFVRVRKVKSLVRQNRLVCSFEDYGIFHMLGHFGRNDIRMAISHIL